MKTRAIDKHFSPDELAQLLSQAASQLIKRCRDAYCDPIPPEPFVFVLVPNDAREVSPATPPCNALEAARFLVRDDGAFRDWINVSPIGTCSGSTVLELCYSTAFTHKLLIGPLAMPFEPFQLRGPTLPADWTEGSPRVSLPELDL